MRSTSTLPTSPTEACSSPGTRVAWSSCPTRCRGERIRARIADRRHDRFWRAEALDVLEAAPERQKHVWSAAGSDRAPGQRPGGAEFGHIRLAHQRELKRCVIVDALQRTAQLDRGLIDALGVAVESAAGETEDGAGWRTRVRLQVGEGGGIGPFAARSHTVIPVDDLPLATALV